MGLFAIFFRKTKFIGREVNVLSVLKHYPQSKKGMGSAALTKFSYKFLDKIICQSNDMYADIKKVYSVKASKLVIINNPITEKFLAKEEKQRKENHVFPVYHRWQTCQTERPSQDSKSISQITFPIPLYNCWEWT